MALNSTEAENIAFLFLFMVHSPTCKFKESEHSAPVHKAYGEFLHED